MLAPWRRPRRLTWGLRPGEDPGPLEGDELVADPTWQYTHAVTVAADPADVWPWVAQLGQERAGFYSFERLENLVGCRVRNADRIVADWQSPSVGDEVHLHPTAPPLRVAVVDPPRALVLHGAAADVPGTGPDSTWSFHLRPDGPGRTRLIEHGRTRHGTSVADRLFFGTTLIEPIGFVMGREMLLGIRERAECLVTGGAG